MGKIKNYDDIDVSLIRATDNPREIMSLAANITMKKGYKETHKNIVWMLD